MKWKQGILLQIIKSIVLLALAIVFGAFARFHIFNWHICLMGAILFFFPMFLKWQFSVISVIFSVLIFSILTKQTEYMWIPIIAYGLGTIVIELFTFVKWKIFYLVGTLLGSALIIFTYYFLQRNFVGNNFAAKDLIPLLVQFGIVNGIVFVAYLPLKIVSKFI